MTKKRMKCGLIADFVLPIIIMTELFIGGYFLEKYAKCIPIDCSMKPIFTSKIIPIFLTISLPGLLGINGRFLI